MKGLLRLKRLALAAIKFPSSILNANKLKNPTSLICMAFCLPGFASKNGLSYSLNV
jgi:hypothetical protein